MPALSPFKEALNKLASRTPRAADLSSSEWADVPLALRERAFFSARVTNARLLQDIKDRVEAILNPRTVERDGREVTEGMTITSARAELKQILQGIGYNPGEKAGTIQDLSSDARLNLVLKTNVESAQGYGNYLQGQAPGALDEFPAQELFRAEEREDERPWPTIWMQAGGEIFPGGRMVALKDDNIWTEISRWGTPWPPFDYNSGMWVRDVSRSETEQLGLLEPGELFDPVVEKFNEKLKASTRGLSPELLASLKKSFGDQVVITGDAIKWKEAGVTYGS